MRKGPMVLDTVCLGNFLLAEAAHVLKALYGNSLVLTVEVFDEILAGVPRYPVLKTVRQLLSSKAIRLATLSSEEFEVFAGLLASLQKGEASCIALAQSRRATVATDDKTARRECARLRVRCTGTVGILKKACVEEILTAVQADAILRRMVDQGFYSPVRSISAIT